MSKSTINIREIEPQDNEQLERVIRAVFPEYKLPMVGTAYEDNETPRMYESYQKENEVYFVVVQDGIVQGGAGIKQLNNFEDDKVCELQKMYFSPIVRGKGYGRKLFQKCLDEAESLGYKKCYLESASQLKEAINMYESFGFKHLEGALGETGHYSCGIWMIKEL